TVSSSGAEDLGGNPEGPSIDATFAIDTKAPTVEITAPLTATQVNGTYVVTFTDDELTDAELSIDDAIYVNATSGVTTLSAITGFGALPQGVFTLYLHDTDAAGNIGTDTEIGIIKDSVVPTGTLSVDTDPIFEGDLLQVVTITYNDTMDNSSTPTITFADNVGAATSQADGAWSGVDTIWTESFLITDVNEETAVVTVSSSNARDSANNVEGVSVDATFAIDTKAPTVVITYPLATNQVNGTAIVTFTDDELTDAELSIDDAIYVNATSGVTTLSDITGFNGLPQGAFTLYLHDTDTAGNIGTDSQIGIIKDTVQPTGSVAVDTDPIFEGDLLQVVTVTYDDTMNNLSTPTITFADNVGNATSQADGTWSGGDTIWTESFLITDVNEETAVVTVSSANATDTANNAEGASADATFAIDTAAPVVVITAPLNGNHVQDATVITFTDDELTAPQVSIDDTIYVAATSGVTTLGDVTGFAALPEGTFTLYLKDTDAAGNIGTYTEAGIIKDTGAPTGTLGVDTDPIFEGDLLQVVTVTYDEEMNPAIDPVIAFADNVGAATSQADGTWTGGNTIWTESFLITDVNEETAVVTVSSSGAEDLGGLTEALSVDATFAIDTKAPTVVITAPLTGIEVNRNVTITFTDDELTNAEVSIDDAIYVSVTSGVTSLGDVTGFDALPEGGFTLYLQDIDAAGNIGTDSEIGIIKDSIAPTGTVVVDTDPIFEGDLLQVVTVTFDDTMNNGFGPNITFVGNTGSATSQADGAWSGVDTIWTESFLITDADEETPVVTVSSANAADTAGNPEGTSIDATFAIDTAAPNVNITAPLTGNSVTGTTVVTFTDDDINAPEVSIDDTNYVAATSGVTTLSDITGFNALPEGAFTLYLRDTDAIGNIGADIEAGIIKDTIAQAPDLVHIESDNANPNLVVIDDTVTITINTPENINQPVVTIVGRAAVVVGADDTWSASLLMLGTDPEGIVTFTINYTDLAGNPATEVTAVTDTSWVNFNYSVPTLAPVHIESNNGLNTAYAKEGDIVTISFTASEPIQNVSSTIAGRAATVNNVVSDDWTASIVMGPADPEGLLA
ncbi:MAG: beta strand repeat-containing protein, partial [Planctomycetota bacterium]